ADPRVVVPEPVAEIVPRLAAGPAEVRRLVPVVAGRPQPLDDPLVVALHQLRLALELGAVGVGEARARLGLELVRADVVGPKAQEIVEVSLEVGSRLSRNSKDQVEVEVLHTRFAQHLDGSANGLGRRQSLERREQVRPEAVRTERDPVDATLYQYSSLGGCDRLRVALDGELVAR